LQGDARDRPQPNQWHRDDTRKISSQRWTQIGGAPPIYDLSLSAAKAAATYMLTSIIRCATAITCSNQLGGDQQIRPINQKQIGKTKKNTYEDMHTMRAPKCAQAQTYPLTHTSKTLSLTRGARYRVMLNRDMYHLGRTNTCKSPGRLYNEAHPASACAMFGGAKETQRRAAQNTRGENTRMTEGSRDSTLAQRPVSFSPGGHTPSAAEGTCDQVLQAVHAAPLAISCEEEEAHHWRGRPAFGLAQASPQTRLSSPWIGLQSPAPAPCGSRPSSLLWPCESS